MILVRFTMDGRHKGWRYKEGEEILLPDNLANLAMQEGVARPIQNRQISRSTASRSVEEAKRRSLT